MGGENPTHNMSQLKHLHEASEMQFITKGKKNPYLKKFNVCKKKKLKGAITLSYIDSIFGK